MPLHLHTIGPQQGLNLPSKEWVTRRCDLWLGIAPYVVAVEFVPAGTVVFRPDGRYEDLDARRLEAIS